MEDPIVYARMSLRENIYGHLARLSFFERFLRPGDAVLEFGCGTGVMISMPLIWWGYEVTALDRDADSIAYGREVAAAHGLGSEWLRCEDIHRHEGRYDAIIAAEVFEHCSDAALDDLIPTLLSHLKPDGVLLLSVPNGYGWYEMEAALWKGQRLGALAERLGVRWFVEKVKTRLLGSWVDSPYASSLDSSPHVQRFTYRSLRRRMEGYGMELIDREGTVLAAGPLSHLLFTGLGPVMKLNRGLGKCFSPIAAGYLFALRLRA